MTEKQAREREAEPELVPVGAFAAAMLQAFGCPTVEVSEHRVVVPSAFADFGVAIVGGIAVAGNGMAHSLKCLSAGLAQPVRPDMISSISRRQCLIGCAGNGLWLAIDGPPALAADVRQLTTRLARALEDYPPIDDEDLHADLRAVRLGKAVTSALNQFRDRAIMTAQLAGVVARCAAWAHALTTDSRRSLHRDGLYRLGRQLEGDIEEWARASSPIVQQRVAALVSVAEADIPGASADQVACLFRGMTFEVGAAVDTAPISGVLPGPSWAETTAIAILPRPVAVAMYVYHGLNGNFHESAQVLAHAEVVDKECGNLALICAAALHLWGDGEVPAPVAWRAALAAGR